MRREIGTPGHFICARKCCFRRHTNVDGKYRVSTVGRYHPGGDYETMVSHLGEDGEPLSWAAIAMARYDTAEEADAGHEAMIAKYEANEITEEQRAAIIALWEQLAGRKWE